MDRARGVGEFEVGFLRDGMILDKGGAPGWRAEWGWGSKGELGNKDRY